MHLNYRPDIDGLRAIAVLTVVIYHLGNSVGFHGYLGVDIFFVISGFLITKIIHLDYQSGRFSFLEFYKRRVRRIFPMLIVTVACSSVAAAILFLPSELRSYARSAIAALFFSSNFVFYSETGYFDAEAELKPLLHTWSLSVEEQFYILFPAILLLLFKFKAIKPRYSVAALLLASLLTGLLFPGAIPDASFAFYMFPLRTWELLFGASLALGLFQTRLISNSRANLISLLGAGLIVFGFLITIPEAWPYALQVLPVVAGTSMIIWAGSGTTPPVMNRAISNPVFLFFGQISYSLYLWHWPIFVFVLYAKYGRLSDPERAVIGVICVFVSYLSWKYIEQPFRRFQFRKPTIPVYGGAAVSLFTVVFGAYFLVNDGKVPWSDSDLSHFADVTIGGPHIAFELFPDQQAFRFGDATNESRPEIVLIGDSHSEAILPALDMISSKTGKTGFRIGNSCIAILNVLKNSQNLKDCVETSERQAAYLKSHPEIRLVVIAQRWFARTEDWHRIYGLSNEEYLLLRRQSLLNFVNEISQPDRKVVLLTQVPLIETRLSNVPSMVARMRKWGDPMLQELLPTLSAYLRKNVQILSMLEEVSQLTGAYIAAPHEVLCAEERCRIYDDGGMYYYDDDHLSSYGALKIAHIFEDYLQPE